MSPRTDPPPAPGARALPDDVRPEPAPAGAFDDLAGPPAPWWERLVPANAWTRWPPDRSVMRLLVVAFVAAVLGAAALWAVSGDRGSPPVSSPSLPLATRRSGPGTSARDAPAEAPGSTVAGGWVAVAGAVSNPGLYRVAPDTRVSSLITAAGGLTPEADADRINLAAVVRDGERVYVPRRGEPGAPPIVAGSGSGGSGGSGAGGAGNGGGTSGAVGPVPAGPVDLNRAGADELDRLPGVGPATARAIIDYRTAHGPFTSVEELAEVRGIGPAKLEQLRPLVTV